MMLSSSRQNNKQF